MSNKNGHLVMEALWTVEEVAKVFRASTSWVYKAVERAEIPVVRLGALLRFDPEMIRRFIADRSFVPSASAVRNTTE